MMLAKIGVRPRRHKSEPQLAALIDVLTIIVLFLVVGSVMDTSSIHLFENARLPKSMGKETLENAPQVSINDGKIWFQASQQKYDLNLLAGSNENLEIQKFQDELQLILKGRSADQKPVVQLVTDRDTSYQTIFSAVQILRQSGVESVLFVAEGAAK